MKNLRACRTSALASLLLFSTCTSTKAAQVDLQQRKALASIAGSVKDSQARHSLAEARVVLQQGRPARPANTNEKSGASLVTDSEGHFRFEAINPGEYTLFVRKQGYISSPFYVVELQAGKPTTLDIILDPLEKLSGRVVDETDHPVAGARITPLLAPVPPHAGLTRMIDERGIDGLLTTSDSRGEFELFWPSDEPEAALFAEAQGHAPSRVEVRRFASDTDRKAILIRLPAGLTLRGRVLGNDGRPLSGATIKGARLGARVYGLGVQEEGLLGTTGNNGEFVVRGLLQGTYRLMITHPTHASLAMPKVEIGSSDRQLPDIFLASQAVITGRITNRVGNAISGANIVARAAKEELSIDRVSDRDGRFTLTEFPSGTNVLVWATAPGYISNNKAVEAPERDANLVLAPLVTVRGRVEDAESSSPVRDFVIWSDERSEEKHFHSEEGSFELHGLSPGHVKITAQAAGYQRKTMEVEIHSDELTNTGVFRLSKGVELSGHIVDSDSGEALPDIVVDYKKASGADGAFLLSRSRSQITDANGDFKFDGVPPEKITIIAWSPLYAEAQATVDPTDAKSVEIRLNSGAALSGHVLLMDSVTPVSSAGVSLLSETDGTARGIRTDSAGFFLFTHLPAGKYQLRAEDSSGQAIPQEMVLNDNQRIEGVVLNIEGGATIRGKVTGTLPTERKTVDLAINGPEGFSTFISTDFEGTYAVSGLPLGTIQLLASTSKLRSMSLSMTVPKGVQELTFDIEFPQNARLHGKVMQLGRPVPFADVFIIPAEAQMVRASAKTDEQGKYEIDGLSDGSYSVEIEGARAKNIRVSGDTILDIELSGTN